MQAMVRSMRAGSGLAAKPHLLQAHEVYLASSATSNASAPVSTQLSFQNGASQAPDDNAAPTASSNDSAPVNTQLASQSGTVEEPSAVPGAAATRQDQQQTEGPPRTGRRPAPQLVRQILRQSLVAENAAAKMMAGQRAVLGTERPDLRLLQVCWRLGCHDSRPFGTLPYPQLGTQEEEGAHVKRLERLLPEHRARPSLLGPAAAATGFALGAAAAVLPQRLGHAITGAVQDALTDQYTDQLRDLREAGLAEQTEQVRETLRALRDQERAPGCTVKVPDIMSLQNPRELTPEEGVAAVVKFGVSQIFKASRG